MLDPPKVTITEAISRDTALSQIVVLVNLRSEGWVAVGVGVVVTRPKCLLKNLIIDPLLELRAANHVVDDALY